MITAVKKITFPAGHRLWKHEGKCSMLHGHNYTAHLHLTSEKLDELGRVIDFAEIKRLIGDWINANWDHAFILCKDDTEAVNAVTSVSEQRVFLMNSNPTAENMALHLLEVVGPKQLAQTAFRLTRVVLWETESSYVEVTL